MYKWPQGRIVRVCLLLLLLAIGAHLGWYAYQTGINADSRQLWVVCSVYAVVAAIAVGGGIAAFGFHRRAVEFLIGVEAEMAKVEWPKWNSLWRSTLIIAVAIALLSLVLFIVDMGCTGFVSFLNSLGKSLYSP